MSIEGLGQPIKDLRGYLTEDQVHTLIEKAKGNRNQLFLRLLWVCGCRISELLGDKSWYPVNCTFRKEQNCLTRCSRSCPHRPGQELRTFEPAKVEDIDFKESVIYLNLLKRKRYPPPKHRIPLDKKTLQLLKQYITENNLPKTAPIFHFTRQRAFQIIREAGADAGITKVGSKELHNHHMRHSHCIAYVKKNNTLEGLRKLQQRIGHASISTTAGYLQYGEEAKEETEQIFGNW